jgi:hypothetical protein
MEILPKLNIFQKDNPDGVAVGSGLAVSSSMRASLYEMLSLAMKQGHSFPDALNVLALAFKAQKNFDKNLQVVLAGIQTFVEDHPTATVGHVLADNLSPLTAFEKAMLLLIKTKISKLAASEDDEPTQLHFIVSESLASIAKQVMREDQEEVSKRNPSAK